MTEKKRQIRIIFACIVLLFPELAFADLISVSVNRDFRDSMIVRGKVANDLGRGCYRFESTEGRGSLALGLPEAKIGQELLLVLPRSIARCGAVNVDSRLIFKSDGDAKTVLTLDCEDGDPIGAFMRMSGVETSVVRIPETVFGCKTSSSVDAVVAYKFLQSLWLNANRDVISGREGLIPNEQLVDGVTH